MANYLSAYNVKDYGATGDGTTDDTASIRTAVGAAVTGGGGTVFFPNGTYVVSEYASNTYRCLEIPTNVRFLGESRESVVIQLAASQAASVRPIYTDGVDASIETMTIDGNKTNQEADEHRAGIICEGAVRFTARNITSRNNSGDALHIHSDCRDFLTEDCLFTTSDRDGIAISGTGSERVTIRKCQCIANAAEQLDTEPETGIVDLTVEDCLLDPAGVTSDYPLTISGASASLPSTGFVIRNNVVLGPVFCIWADAVRITDNRIKSEGAFPALQISRQCRDAVVANNELTNTDTCTAGSVIYIEGNQSGDAGSVVKILGNIVNASNGNDGIYAANVLSTEIVNNTIVGGSTNTQTYGIEIRSVSLPAMESVIVNGNRIVDFKRAVLVWGNSEQDNAVNDLVLIDNVCEKDANESMTAAFDLDFDAQHTVKACMVANNELVGIATAFNTYPACPMLIGGTRNGGGLYSLTGTPESNLIELVGAMALRRDGSSTTTLYVKTSGSGNTGWTAK